MPEQLQEIMDELKIASAETFYHSIHVKAHVYKMIRKMNQDGFTAYSCEEINSICKGTLLHDVGKLYVRNFILTKDSRLTSEERESMTAHPRLGFEAVKTYLTKDEYEIIKNICLYHHERCDGKGYAGITELPVYVQVVSICDVYDALTTDRIYHTAISHDAAIELIERGECGKFNSEIIAYLKKTME